MRTIQPGYHVVHPHNSRIPILRKNRPKGSRPTGWFGDDKKSATIFLRVSTAEKAAYHEAASTARISLSDWIRRRLRLGLKQRKS